MMAPPEGPLMSDILSWGNQNPVEWMTETRAQFCTFAVPAPPQPTYFTLPAAPLAPMVTPPMASPMAPPQFLNMPAPSIPATLTAAEAAPPASASAAEQPAAPTAAASATGVAALAECPRTRRPIGRNQRQQLQSRHQRHARARARPHVVAGRPSTHMGVQT
jgi:hypothetical protein